MFKSTLTVLALMGAASAANSTTSLWLIGFDQQNVLGSLIASVCIAGSRSMGAISHKETGCQATTYSLTCGDPENCGTPSPFTFTQGPSTVAYSYAENDTIATETVNLGCVVTDSASGVCSVTMNAVSAISSVTITSFTDASDLGLQVVTLTASTAISNIAATTTTGSGKPSATSTSKSSSGPASGTAAPDSQNGGIPMVTQAPFLMGAMAAGLAFAAM